MELSEMLIWGVRIIVMGVSWLPKCIAWLKKRKWKWPWAKRKKVRRGTAAPVSLRRGRKPYPGGHKRSKKGKNAKSVKK